MPLDVSKIHKKPGVSEVREHYSIRYSKNRPKGSRVEECFGLFLVNKEIREEALKIFFTRNYFRFTSVAAFNNLVPKVSAAHNFLTHVKIDLGAGNKFDRKFFWEFLPDMPSLQLVDFYYVGRAPYHSSLAGWVHSRFPDYRAVLYTLLRKHKSLDKALDHFILPECFCLYRGNDCVHESLSLTLVKDLMEADQAKLKSRKSTLRSGKQK